MLTDAVRHLADRGGGLVQCRRDLVVRQVEDLAEHEHRALGRAERLEHGEQRHRDALGELEILGDVRRGQQRLGEPLADVVLAAARERS